MSLSSSQIKNIVYQEGFQKVGITSSVQPSKSKLLDQWLKDGFHGNMNWMLVNKKKRMDIEIFFPGAKSIICVAHNYYTSHMYDQSQKTGKISRYARGEDYHKIIKKKLKIVLNKIKKIDPTINGRLCVDTAPIMEKLWAEKAGVGWQGKHTNLITKDFGSWVFLGEIIIDRELDYDSAAEDHCGKCQACIDACPTKAIIEPYKLDARKCISYLTIEYWDKPIPEELKVKMNSWIFGCDICQEVCPWNKNQRESSEPCYYPKPGNINPDLDTLSEIDEPTFKQKYKKSPITRTGWINFIRNIHAVKTVNKGQ